MLKKARAKIADLYTGKTALECRSSKCPAVGSMKMGTSIHRINRIVFNFASLRLCVSFLSLLLLCSCANTTTSRGELTLPDGKVIKIESPADYKVTGLYIKTPNGTIVKAKSITSKKNVALTTAQGKRESAITGKAVEGAVQGAVKGMKGGL